MYVGCIMTSKDLDALMNCCDNYILIDVGANIINKKFARDVDSVIQRAKDAGKNNIVLMLYYLFNNTFV